MDRTVSGLGQNQEKPSFMTHQKKKGRPVHKLSANEFTSQKIQTKLVVGGRRKEQKTPHSMGYQ